MQKKITPVVKKVATKKVVAKKVVAKKINKKVLNPVKKTPTKKTETEKTLLYADNDHSFWVKNGQVLNSLIALQEALASMEKEIFAHHVGGEKNDFADWVDSVLCDKICAADLRKTKTSTSARTAIIKHLKSYKL